MGLNQIFTRKKKKFTWIDVASDEVAMFALAILLAKYVPAVASLDWYWYVIIAVIFIIKPIKAMAKK